MVFGGEAGFGELGFGVGAVGADADDLAVLAVGGVGDGEALFVELGDGFFGEGGLGEDGELDVELAGTVFGAGDAGGFGLGELLLESHECAVGLVEEAEALLGGAEAEEEHGFELGVGDAVGGGGPLVDGGFVVVLEEGDVGQAGADVGVEIGGGAGGEGADVDCARLLEVGGGFGGGRGDAVFDGAGLAVEVLGGGEGGGVGRLVGFGAAGEGEREQGDEESESDSSGR